jgi:hypothetical protein
MLCGQGHEKLRGIGKESFRSFKTLLILRKKKKVNVKLRKIVKEILREKWSEAPTESLSLLSNRELCKVST